MMKKVSLIICMALILCGVVPDIPLDRQHFYDNEALLNVIKGVR